MRSRLNVKRKSDSVFRSAVDRRTPNRHETCFEMLDLDRGVTCSKLAVHFLVAAGQRNVVRGVLTNRVQFLGGELAAHLGRDPGDQ